MPISIILALAAISQDTARPPSFSQEVIQRADSVAEAEFAKDSLGSITVGVVAGPKLVWAKSYGYADKAKTRRADPTTLYRVASVTKQFTALMLLQLIERGRVRLADPVERYLPEVRSVRRTSATDPLPTLLQLATMTSGLARDPDDRRPWETGPVTQWESLLLRALPKTRYARAPGTGYGYSNVGYAILGAALSRAAREEYTAYQRRHILAPLGMTSSAFELTAALGARLAVGVDYDELYRDTLNYEDAARGNAGGLGISVPSGSLYSTVGDLAKMVSLAIGHGPPDIVSPEMLALREKVGVSASADLDYGYGLGFQALRWGDTVAVGQSGNLAGYTSMVLYDTKRKFGVIVLRSAAGGHADSGRLAGRVFRRLLASLE